MANYRAQISFQLDSGFPRDAMTINPHYFGDDAQGLADRLKTNLLALSNVGALQPFTIKIYDAEKAPPSYPLAQAQNLTGFVASTAPREICLCLSYYSTWNRPGYRGRLYIPHNFIGGTVGLRPTNGHMTTVLAWANTLFNGLPQGTNWIVWSKKMKKGYGVTNFWCDDEWDIQRSRGLKGTTRVTGVVA